MNPGTPEAVETAVAVTGGFFAAGAQGEEGSASKVTVAMAGFVVYEARKYPDRLFRRLFVTFAVTLQGGGIGFKADAQAVLRGRNAMCLDGSEGEIALAETSGCFQCLFCLISKIV